MLGAVYKPTVANQIKLPQNCGKLLATHLGELPQANPVNSEVIQTIARRLSEGCFREPTIDPI